MILIREGGLRGNSICPAACHEHRAGVNGCSRFFPLKSGGEKDEMMN